MKRFHVHLGVDNLEQSIRFYSGLFGAEPTVRRPDYAKWMVEDPRLNFAISQRGGKLGVNHLGLQADSAHELAGLRTRFAAAAAATVVDEPGANCCYAKSDKHWVTDPQGIAWEGYHTLGDVRFFAGDAEVPTTSACCATEPADTSECRAPAANTATACCTPAAAASASSCCRPAVPARNDDRGRAACCS